MTSYATAPTTEQKPKVAPTPAPIPGMTPYTGQPANAAMQPPAAPTPSPIVPPPPAPAPTSSAPAGVPTSPMGAGNNLLSTQINPGAPTATPPTTNFGSGAITAGAPVNPADSARMADYSSKLDGSVNELTTGPNRTALAQQALRDFDIEGLPQLEQGYRRVGQRAAALGRLGAGMTTNDLTGLSATYQRDRGLMARGLARDVAEGDINDRFRRVDALSGLRGQEEGIQSGRRGEMRQDRGYQTDVDRFNSDALFDRQRAGNDYSADYQDRLYGQERGLRDELRGERGYQTDRSDKALEDSIRQRVLEESLLDSGFGRAQDRLSAGSYGSPSDAYERSADALSADAGALMGDGAELLTRRSAGKPSPIPGLDMEAFYKLLQGLG